MRTAALVALIAACAAPTAAIGGATTPASCGTVSYRVQNGNQLFVPGGGPQCLYTAYTVCRPAVLSVVGHGVDTLSRLTFQIERSGVCRIALSRADTVFFGSKTHVTRWTGTCKGAATRAEGIVVRGCTQGDYLLSPPGAPDVPNNRF